MGDIVSRLPTQDQSDGATGAAIPSEAILVGGTDGTNLRAISTSSTGIVNVEQPIQTVTGTLTNGSSVVTMTMQGAGAVNIDVSGSGFVGTITVTENTPSSARVLGVFALNGSAIASSITANGTYRVIGVPVAPTISVQFSSYTSGSATIYIYASAATYIVQPYNSNAANLQTTTYLNDGSGNSISSVNNALTVNTKSPLTFSAPTTATVNTTSTLILAANTARRGLCLSNTSPQQISLGFNGNAASYQNGITLFPGEKFLMDEYSFSTGAIYAVTTGATTYIGVQEMT
jgi:hypothetical protein